MDELNLEAVKRENLRLSQELRAAIKTIDKLLKDNEQKSEKIAHLESMLTKTVPIIGKKSSLALDIAPEEEIAEIQLKKLQETARNRHLTLEETRIYDLLVKNKRLSQNKSTSNVSEAQFRDVSEAELLEIAGQVDDSGK